MSFSDFKFFPTKGAGAIKANGSFVYNGAVRINCTVVQGSKGLFVSLPRQKYQKDGKDQYADQVFFINEDTRKQLQSAVLAAYNGNQTTGDQGASPEPAPQTNGKPARSNTIPF